MSQLNYTPIDGLLEEYLKGSPKSSTISITKEGEPITIAAEVAPKKDFILTESEPKVEDKEVKEFVEMTKNEPTLSPELKKAGLNVVESSSLDPKHKITLPITDDKILEGLDKPMTTSWRWLAEFARFFLVQAHITLKKIHGKVVRIIQR
jgi:hypothetical protein